VAGPDVWNSLPTDIIRTVAADLPSKTEYSPFQTIIPTSCTFGIAVAAAHYLLCTFTGHSGHSLVSINSTYRQYCNPISLWHFIVISTIWMSTVGPSIHQPADVRQLSHHLLLLSLNWHWTYLHLIFQPLFFSKSWKLTFSQFFSPKVYIHSGLKHSVLTKLSCLISKRLLILWLSIIVLPLNRVMMQLFVIITPMLLPIWYILQVSKHKTKVSFI